MDKSTSLSLGSEKPSIDDKAIINIISTGDNTAGLFTPYSEKKETDQPLHQEVDQSATVLIKGIKKTYSNVGEYIARDMLKNPQSHTVDTPRGKMSIVEALRLGYNMATKRFDKMPVQSDKEKYMKNLKDPDRKILERMMDPRNKVRAAEAASLGLSPQHRAVAQPKPVQPEEQPTEPAKGQEDQEAAALLGAIGSQKPVK